MILFLGLEKTHIIRINKISDQNYRGNKSWEYLVKNKDNRQEIARYTRKKEYTDQ